MADVIEFPVRRNRDGNICCINNCGGTATHLFDLVEIEMRDGKLVPWRDAGKKYFCEVCAPDGATEIARI